MNTKLVLLRKGDEVFFENRKLTVIAQATKGPGKEVVKIDGLPGSNGKKFVSLSKLAQGPNELECEAKAVTSTGSSKRNYVLTADEQAQINELQAKIDAIIEAARARFVPEPDANFDVDKLTEAEKQAKYNEWLRYVAFRKSCQ